MLNEYCIELFQLCESKAEATNKRSEKDAWCVDLLKACDTYLSHVILEECKDLLYA